MGAHSMKLSFSRALSGTVLLLTACGPSEGPGGDLPAQGPETVFSRLEERLLTSYETGLEFHVTAEGAIEVDLQGSLSIGPGEAVKLTALGEFAGEKVDLKLVSDGTSYEFGRKPSLSSGPTPGRLKDALLIGLTRMGILHNLAMLSAGVPPDRAEGGVRDWTVAHDFFFGPQEASEGMSETVGFSMTVDGVPAGTASLKFDDSGLPVLRLQTVQFPEGEMRVSERYRAVRIRP